MASHRYFDRIHEHRGRHGEQPIREVSSIVIHRPSLADIGKGSFLCGESPVLSVRGLALERCRQFDGAHSTFGADRPLVPRNKAAAAGDPGAAPSPRSLSPLFIERYHSLPIPLVPCAGSLSLCVPILPPAVARAQSGTHPALVVPQNLVGRRNPGISAHCRLASAACKRSS